MIVERPGQSTLLVEIKSATMVDDRAFKRDIKNSEALVISQDKNSKLIDGVQCFFWQNGIDYIFE